MKLFKKEEKAPIPKLTHLEIRVNLTELDQWIEKQGSIEPVSASEWSRDQEVNEFSIQLLPTENFAFFHRKTGIFSSSPNAAITIHPNDMSKSYVLYWDWNQSYFRAYIDLGNPDGSANYKTIFSAPIDEMIHIMKIGTNIPISNSEDQTCILKIDDDIHCSSVFVDKSAFRGVKYSNQVFCIWVFAPPVDDFQLYN